MLVATIPETSFDDEKKEKDDSKELTDPEEIEKWFTS
jgi:hypothetical protein